MKDRAEQVKQLLEKAEWTAEERQWLLDYLKDSEGTELKLIMQQLFSREVENEKVVDPLRSDKLLKSIHEKIDSECATNGLHKLRSWRIRLAVAASVVGLMLLSGYYLFEKRNRNELADNNVNHNSSKEDIAPGSDKAELTLANGMKITLDSASNGSLASQGITKITGQNGLLIYSVAPNAGAQGEVMYNTLTTPRGGQQKIILADGSEIWLNAASSLHFPTVFTGKERKVEVTGEAYFEIAKNADMPFIVSVNQAEIRVVGTHFNVMSYNDEAALTTTLLEGSVRFINANDTSILKPGQQSQLTKDGQVKIVTGVNTDEVIAWKNEFFYFEGAGIEQVMRQLSRWYDVDVEYDQKPDDLFYAEIPRSTQLSDVLKALALTGRIRFEIEGRSIIVMP